MDDKFSSFKAAQIVKEMETRDVRWLRGDVDRIIPTFETPSVEYKARVLNPHEGRTADRLGRLGFPVHMIVDEKKDPNRRGCRIGYPDFEDGIEIKTPRDAASAKSATSNGIENSLGKVGLKRIIIDFSESARLKDREILADAFYARKYYSRDVMVSILLKNGMLRNL